MSASEPVSIADVVQRIDALTAHAAAGVLGYITQCAVCPQQAVLSYQPRGWECPRCAEVVDGEVADDWEDYLPVSKVQG